MPGSILSFSLVLFHLMFTQNLSCRCCYYSHFVHEEAEAQWRALLEVSPLVKWRNQASNTSSLISEALTTVSVPLCLEVRGVLIGRGTRRLPEWQGRTGWNPWKYVQATCYEANDHTLETCFRIASLCDPNSNKYCRCLEEGQLWGLIVSWKQ